MLPWQRVASARVRKPLRNFMFLVRKVQVLLVLIFPYRKLELSLYISSNAIKKIFTIGSLIRKIYIATRTSIGV